MFTFLLLLTIAFAQIPEPYNLKEAIKAASSDSDSSDDSSVVPAKPSGSVNPVNPPKPSASSNDKKDDSSSAPATPSDKPNTTAKYAFVSKYGGTYYTLNKCLKIADKQSRKYVSVSQTKIKAEDYANDKCENKATKSEEVEGKVSQYLNELPRHIGYKYEYLAKVCTSDPLSFQLYFNECKKSGNTYSKSEIIAGTLSTNQYTDDKCTKKASVPLSDLESYKCDVCDTKNDAYKAVCTMHPDVVNTEDKNYASKQYLIKKNGQVVDVMYLGKCVYNSDYVKYTGYNNNTIKIEKYGVFDKVCGNAVESTRYEPIIVNGFQYADAIPSNIAHLRKYALGEECGAEKSYLVTAYTDECLANGTEYTKYVIENNKFVLKSFSDKECKTVKKEVESNECGKCRTEEYEQMKYECKALTNDPQPPSPSNPDGSKNPNPQPNPSNPGNNDGTAASFVLMVVALLALLF